jgi:hypothetical protein
MSNSLAIATVTAALRNLLTHGLNSDPELADASVSTKPPDLARDSNTNNQLNLFLYRTEPNPAMGNLPMPHQTRPGETAEPPLALNLHYLITAYGRDNDDVLGHRLLGRAMSLLHDHPLLAASEIETALEGNDLHQQVERVRITPVPLSTEEMSNLWTTFQSQYRISVAYQLALVLIESTRPVKTPLPVLARADEDQGAHVLGSAAPFLREIRAPDRKPAAEPGDQLLILGERLDAESAAVRFSTARNEAPIELTAAGGSEQVLQVTLPDASTDAQAPASWPPGIYTVCLVIRRPGLPAWTTNQVAMTLAPVVESISPDEAAAGDVTLELTCHPQVRAEQRVTLLFGDREIGLGSLADPADASSPSTLSFEVTGAEPGEHVIRLRVDGVDSMPVDFAAQPPVFAADQKVTIT